MYRFDLLQWEGVSVGVSSAEFAAAAAALRRGAARCSGAVQLGPLRLHVQACLGQGAFASVFQARSMTRLCVSAMRGCSDCTSQACLGQGAFAGAVPGALISMRGAILNRV